MSFFGQTLFPSLFLYTDCYISCVDSSNKDEIATSNCLHVLNHVIKTRSQILQNDNDLSNTNDDDEQEEEEEEIIPRDQGFTRPTVLVMLPTRGVCYTFVHRLKQLLNKESRFFHIERFNTEYGPATEEELESEDARRKEVQRKKGVEWNELFGDEVNSDDDFKIGVSISPNHRSGNKNDSDASADPIDSMTANGSVAVKLYSDFFKSDIIIASPLALKVAIDEKGNADFLSSIEICLIDLADVLLMQNWEHVESVLESMNVHPQQTDYTDFSRIRQYFLTDQPQQHRWRQLLVYSPFLDPQITSTFKRFGQSRAGATRIRRRYDARNAAINFVAIPIQQMFQRIQTTSIATHSQDRLKYFRDNMLSHIRRRKHSMLYIPSYFEFVSLRNLLLKEDVDFVSVTEYSRVSEVSRGRARFLQGRKPIMLYTGRANFFHRHVIKGVRHLVFYGLPEHAEFYTDLLNQLNSGSFDGQDNDDEGPSMAVTNNVSCVVIFTKYEGHALERIVGREHCERMLKGSKNTYVVK